jgi:hypothetical protein
MFDKYRERRILRFQVTEAVMKALRLIAKPQPLVRQSLTPHPIDGISESVNTRISFMAPLGGSRYPTQPEQSDSPSAPRRISR